MKVLLTFIILLCASYISYTLWENRFIPPCTRTITYSLGSFDKRFGVSETEFLDALTQAERLWETATPDLNLLAYSATSSQVKVNLIYDYRQAATVALNNIEGELKTNNVEYAALRSEYNTLKSQYESLSAQYESSLSMFNTQNAEYEEALNTWNDGPRTNKRQYDELKQKQDALGKELEGINKLENSLNELVKKVNLKVAELNDKARELNLEVRSYNEIGEKRGDTFAGGIYVSDKAGERIDIYEFENRTKLVRVLAHELGHALGLDHVDEREAIMYGTNIGRELSLMPSDKVALLNLCSLN